MKSRTLISLCTAVAATLLPCRSHGASPADEPLSDATTAPASTDQSTDAQRWSAQGQFTNVTQMHPRFTSPYSGTNSLGAERSTKETSDLTGYFGFRPWHDTDLWIDPEVDQGFGLSSTVGVAGFPSGEAYKVGANAPYFRLPRAIARHVFSLGDDDEQVETAPNQFAGSRPVDNVTVTVGKFSVVDLFDNNSYAHDPRNDFMNWSIVDAGAFDYAADAWGFTYGGAAEWTQDFWSVRAGLFQMSRVPNGKIVDVDFRNRSAVVELEERHRLASHPGKLKLLVFANRASMASYADAVRFGEAIGAVPDVATVRRRATRGGLSLNAEQEFSPSIGGFVKISGNDGRREAYEFTEVNRSITGGVALKGAVWNRPDDTFGIAAVVNGLSGDARRYFAAGGIGILIGDGRLDYGLEQIVETYYALDVVRHVALSLDYQFVEHPAYNRARGPVPVYGARLHADF